MMAGGVTGGPRTLLGSDTPGIRDPAPDSGVIARQGRALCMVWRDCGRSVSEHKQATRFSKAGRVAVHACLSPRLSAIPADISEVLLDGASIAR